MQVIAVAMFVKNHQLKDCLVGASRTRSGVGSGVNVINGSDRGTYVSVLVLLSVLASVGSIVTYIIIVVANRAEPDPTGNRTSAVYHVGTAFIALWLEIAGSSRSSSRCSTSSAPEAQPTFRPKFTHSGIRPSGDHHRASPIDCGWLHGAYTPFEGDRVGG